MNYEQFIPGLAIIVFGSIVMLILNRKQKN